VGRKFKMIYHTEHQAPKPKRQIIIPTKKKTKPEYIKKDNGPARPKEGNNE